MDYLEGRVIPPQGSYFRASLLGKHGIQLYSQLLASQRTYPRYFVQYSHPGCSRPQPGADFPVRV